MASELSSEFREILNSRISELIERTGDTVTNMAEGTGNFPDPTDRAAIETDRAVLLRVRDRERKLLKKLHYALDRLNAGHYGECERCGMDIGAERLRARPEATMCIDCKHEVEEDEQRRKQRPV